MGKNERDTTTIRIGNWVLRVEKDLKNRIEENRLKGESYAHAIARMYVYYKRVGIERELNDLFRPIQALVDIELGSYYADATDFFKIILKAARYLTPEEREKLGPAFAKLLEEQMIEIGNLTKERKGYNLAGMF